MFIAMLRPEALALRQECYVSLIPMRVIIAT
jgi:hypothetical protein